MAVVEDLRAGISGALLRRPAVLTVAVAVAVEAQVGHLVKVIIIIVVVAVDVKVKSGETDLLFSHGKNKLWNV